MQQALFRVLRPIFGAIWLMTGWGTFLAVCPSWGIVEAQTGLASYYGIEACRVNPDPRCPTASGRSLYPLANAPYMAAWFGTFGSRWQVCGPTGCAVAEVWDRGPAKRLRRIADLSPQVFEAVCGSLRQGVCQVSVEPQ